MKVRLKRMDVLPLSKNVSDHDYTIDMFGVVFNVIDVDVNYYKVNGGKFNGYMIYKEHVEVV